MPWVPQRIIDEQMANLKFWRETAAEKVRHADVLQGALAEQSKTVEKLRDQLARRTEEFKELNQKLYAKECEAVTSELAKTEAARREKRDAARAEIAKTAAGRRTLARIDWLVLNGLSFSDAMLRATQDGW